MNHNNIAYKLDTVHACKMFQKEALSRAAIHALFGGVAGGTAGAIRAEPENRLRNALLGALTGSAIGGGSSALGKKLSPAARNTLEHLGLFGSVLSAVTLPRD